MKDDFIPRVQVPIAEASNKSPAEVVARPSFFSWLPLFVLFTGIGLSIGFIVPSVFELAQKPAARQHHPAMERAAVTVFVLTIVATPLFTWLRNRIAVRPTASGNFRKLQFGLREILILTTAMAFSLAIVPLLNEPLWVNGWVVAVVLGIIAWSYFCDWNVRWRVGALIASLFLPFAWMIAYNVPFGRTSGLAVNIPVGPAILPAELLRSLLDLDVGPDGTMGIASLIAIVELILGARLARRGGKLAVAYIALMLLSASLSSLLFHALYRA